MSFVDWFKKAPRLAKLPAIAILAFLSCLIIPGCGSEQLADIDEAKSEASTVSRPALSIGDPAPPLQIDQWVVGAPVDEELSGGDVHVVEFWATWCAPCRAGMPHISELQQQYGDEVTFVGVTEEDPMTVRHFLIGLSPDGRKWGEVIKYRLATDARGGTNTTYMKAARQPSIPTAFIVGRTGLIEWIGHPGKIDGPLQQVVDGTWDRQQAIKSLEHQQRLKALTAKLNDWVASRKWNELFAELDKVEAETGSSTDLMFIRMAALQVADRAQEAREVRSGLIELAWDDATTLNALAWNLANNGPSTDLDQALRAAERASELRNDEDPIVFETIARVHFARRDLEEAIRWQRRAVENAQVPNNYERTLEQFLMLSEQQADPPATENKADD